MRPAPRRRSRRWPLAPSGSRCGPSAKAASTRSTPMAASAAQARAWWMASSGWRRSSMGRNNSALVRLNICRGKSVLPGGGGSEVRLWSRPAPGPTSSSKMPPGRPQEASFFLPRPQPAEHLGVDPDPLSQPDVEPAGEGDVAAALQPAHLEARGGAQGGADGARGHHGIALGIEQQGGDPQLSQPRSDARTGVVVRGVGEAVAGSHDAIVPLAEGADAGRLLDGQRLGTAGGDGGEDADQPSQQVAAVEPAGGRVDLLLGKPEVERRADGGHGSDPRVLDLGPPAQ